MWGVKSGCEERVKSGCVRVARVVSWGERRKQSSRAELLSGDDPIACQFTQWPTPSQVKVKSSRVERFTRRPRCYSSTCQRAVAEMHRRCKM